MTLKLEVGKTYATKPNPDGSMGRAFTIRDMQTVGTLKMFREFPGSKLVWTEGGGNISGQQDLALVMEVPSASAPVAPSPTPKPVSASPVAPVPAAAPVVAPAAVPGRVVLEIDWNARTVRLLP